MQRGAIRDPPCLRNHTSRIPLRFIRASMGPPVVNPKALGSAHDLIKSSVFSTLCPRTESSCHGVGGQRVENTDSASFVGLSVCTVLKRLVSFRAGTCRASTTFYPCRLVAGHLISYALLSAGDTNYERAPSTKSVRSGTRPDDGRTHRWRLLKLACVLGR